MKLGGHSPMDWCGVNKHRDPLAEREFRFSRGYVNKKFY